MSNKYLIVACENEISYTYFNSYKKVGVERGTLDLLNNNQDIEFAISDFDNVTKQELDLIKQKVLRVDHLSPEKDWLDGESAIISVIDKGATDIVFVAKPTKRMDMNSTFLYFIEKYNIKMINNSSIAFKISKGKTVLEYSRYQGYKYISFIPLEMTNFNISQLKYNVKNLEVCRNSPRAFSNEFIPEIDALVEVDHDIICIMTK